MTTRGRPLGTATRKGCPAEAQTSRQGGAAVPPGASQARHLRTELPSDRPSSAVHTQD